MRNYCTWAQFFFFPKHPLFLLGSYAYVDIYENEPLQTPF